MKKYIAAFLAACLIIGSAAPSAVMAAELIGKSYQDDEITRYAAAEMDGVLSQGEIIDSSVADDGISGENDEFSAFLSDKSNPAGSAVQSRNDEGTSVQDYELYDDLGDRIKKSAEAADQKTVKIDIRDMKIEKKDLKAVLMNTLNLNPEIFYVESSFRYYYDQDGNITSIELNLTHTGDEIKKRSAEVETAAEYFLDRIADSKMSQWEIVLAVHDYIASSVEYDYDGLKNGNLNEDAYDIYGALVKKKAVCQGYSLAAEYLLQKSGITTGIASSENADHAWNLVKIGGEWYHMDITWDDPVYDNLGKVRHSFVLISDDVLFSDKECQNRYDYVTSVPGGAYGGAGGRAFDDMFWKNSDTYIHYYSGNWYYADSNSSRIVRFSPENGMTETVMYDDMVWKLPESQKTYSGNYMRIAADGDRLYYSGPESIYFMDLDTEKSVKIFTPEEEGLIFGLGNCDGTIGYVVKNSPDSSGPEEIHSTDIDMYCRTAIDSIVTYEGRFSVEFDDVKMYDDTGRIIPVKYVVYYKKYNESRYKVKESSEPSVSVTGLAKNTAYHIECEAVCDSGYGVDENNVSGGRTDQIKAVSNTVNTYIPKPSISRVSLQNAADRVRVEVSPQKVNGKNVTYHIWYKRTSASLYNIVNVKKPETVLSGLYRNSRYEIKVRYTYTDSTTGKTRLSSFSDVKYFTTKAK